jgi:hypothetical protein
LRRLGGTCADAGGLTHNDESGWWLHMPTVNVYAGSAWILGWKSEAFNKRVLLKEGGKLELIGYDSYSQGKGPKRPEEEVPIVESRAGSSR